MERSTMFNGKIHYFDWVIFNSYVKLPEGNPKKTLVSPSLMGIIVGYDGDT